MIVYDMIMGRNPATDEILGVLDLNLISVRRFRDCGINFEESYIWVLTRTGSENLQGDVNKSLKDHPNYIIHQDDNFDGGYESYKFNFPYGVKEQQILNRLREYPYSTTVPNMKDVYDSLEARDSIDGSDLIEDDGIGRESGELISNLTEEIEYARSSKAFGELIDMVTVFGEKYGGVTFVDITIDQDDD